jgi:hypothetical protein
LIGESGRTRVLVVVLLEYRVHRSIPHLIYEGVLYEKISDPRHYAAVSMLNVQRRMRPEISQLIRRVYPNLQDHESVLNLPDVVGMRHNLFWLDHRYAESTKDNGTRVKSHSNQWEVEMATALVRHLVPSRDNTKAVISPS